MDLTEDEKKELFEEFRDKFSVQIKTEAHDKIEEINQNIQTKYNDADKLKERIDVIETKMGRLPREGVLGFEKEGNKTESGIMPLVFQDSAGKEHKALRLGENLFQGEPEAFSIGKILAAKITGNTKGLNDFEMKAIGEGIGAAGGFLLSETVSAKVIDLARNLACVMQAGAYTIPMPTPELRLVKVTSEPQAYWRAEHGEITESEWTLEPINLKAMTVGVLCRASREILEDAANAGTALQNAMAATIALAMDRVALLGNGVTEPRGLDLCDGINIISMGVNGAVLEDYDPFSNAVEKIADSNGEANAVIFSPRTFFTLDRLKESATVLQPLVPPPSFQELKKFKTNQIGNTDTQGTATNASKAFIGAYQNLLFGIRKNVEIEMTTSGGTGTFAKVEALIRTRMRFDVAVLRENHFTKIEGIIPA